MKLYPIVTLLTIMLSACSSGQNHSTTDQQATIPAADTAQQQQLAATTEDPVAQLEPALGQDTATQGLPASPPTAEQYPGNHVINLDEEFQAAGCKISEPVWDPTDPNRVQSYCVLIYVNQPEPNVFQRVILDIVGDDLDIALLPQEYVLDFTKIVGVLYFGPPMETEDTSKLCTVGDVWSIPHRWLGDFNLIPTLACEEMI